MFLKFLLCVILYSKVCFANNSSVYLNSQNYSYLSNSAQNLLEANSISEAELGSWVPRVINGFPAKLGDVPYQIAMKALVNRARSEYKTFCGATIIAPSKMITAAHCFEERGLSNCHKFLYPGQTSRRYLNNKYAVAGNLYNKAKYTADGPRGQWRTLKRVVYPKKYIFPKHDIAVAYSNSPFVFTSNIAPVPFATVQIDYQSTCLVSGYGRTGHTKRETTEVLLLAHLQLLPRQMCSRIHRRRMDAFICTSAIVSDVGKGDSGGPLVCKGTGDPNESGRGVLVGVVSGHSRGRGSFFTRVTRYQKFIKNKSTIVTSMIMCNDIYYTKTNIAIAMTLIYKTLFLF